MQYPEMFTEKEGQSVFTVTLLNIYVVFRVGLKKQIIRWFC